MLAGGRRGAWSQNVDCDIFPLHYTLYQSIKNARNKMEKIRQTNFYTITASERRRCAATASELRRCNEHSGTLTLF